MRKFKLYLIVVFCLLAIPAFSIGYMQMGAQGIKAAEFVSAFGTAAGNIWLGTVATIGGTAPTGQVILKANSTAPDATTDNLIFISAKDASEDAEATLSIYAEQDATTDTSDHTSDTYIRIWWNGKSYKLLALYDSD
jgi:hypothetical protein